MFSFGKKKDTAPAAPEPAAPTILSEETGYAGTADKVADGARLDVQPKGYTAKIPLMQGTMRAFREGRPENLRAFLRSYMVYKNELGSFAKIDTQDTDPGTTALITSPVLRLIEESTDPAAAVAAIAADLPPFYAQTLLDITLRRAANQNSVYAVEALLEMGADVNCYGGRPLSVAYSCNHPRIAAVLLKYAPDIDLTRRTQFTAGDTAELEKFDAFLAAAKLYPLPTSKAGLKHNDSATPSSPAAAPKETTAAIRKPAPKNLDI